MLYDAEEFELKDRLDFARLLGKKAKGFRSNLTKSLERKEVEISLVFTIDGDQYGEAVDKHIEARAKQTLKAKDKIIPKSPIVKKGKELPGAPVNLAEDYQVVEKFYIPIEHTVPYYAEGIND